MSDADRRPRYTKQRHFRIPDPLFEEFAANAAEDGLGASEMVRELMREYNARKRAARWEPVGQKTVF